MESETKEREQYLEQLAEKMANALMTDAEKQGIAVRQLWKETFFPKPQPQKDQNA